MVDKDEQYANARKLYDEVLRVVNKILHDCKHLPISILQLADEPSYEELAEVLDFFSDVLAVISIRVGDDEGLADKAKEYVGYAKGIVVAITTDNKAQLDKLVAELDKRSFL